MKRRFQVDPSGLECGTPSAGLFGKRSLASSRAGALVASVTVMVRLDSQPVDWLIREMKWTVGIFEAKTKFSEICARVAETGDEYVVTKRGRQLVRIVPVAAEEMAKGRSILEDMAEYERVHGPLPDDEPDFPEVWLERTRSVYDPFEDEREDDE